MVWVENSKNEGDAFDISKLSDIGETYINSKKVDMSLNGDDIKTNLS